MVDWIRVVVRGEEENLRILSFLFYFFDSARVFFLCCED